MNPRAWIVTKQGMTGDLYEALAWDNGGKPLGVSCTPPIPLYEAMPASHKPTYDDAAIRELIVTIQSNREAIRRALEAWDATTNSKSHDGHLWQCMEELEIEALRLAGAENRIPEVLEQHPVLPGVQS
jgi:hypothetical protein